MERTGDVRLAIWLWQASKRVCHYLFVDEEEKVATIDVPVRLVIDVIEQEKFVIDALRTDGALRVSVCTICYALAPAAKITDHMDRHVST